MKNKSPTPKKDLKDFLTDQLILSDSEIVEIAEAEGKDMGRKEASHLLKEILNHSGGFSADAYPYDKLSQVCKEAYINGFMMSLFYQRDGLNNFIQNL